jgi:hypothetical protein
LTTPALSEEDLKDVLGKLGVLAVFNDGEIHEAYFEIAKIYGSWMAAEESKLVSPVASALRSTGKNLIEASRFLNGRAIGLRNQVEFEVTTLTTQILALNPTVGGQDNAQQLVSTFQLVGTRQMKVVPLCYGTTSLRLSYSVSPRRLALSQLSIRIELIKRAVVGCSMPLKRSNLFLTLTCGHQALKRVENGWNEVVNACLKCIDKTPILADPLLSM